MRSGALPVFWTFVAVSTVSFAVGAIGYGEYSQNILKVGLALVAVSAPAELQRRNGRH